MPVCTWAGVASTAGAVQAAVTVPPPLPAPVAVDLVPEDVAEAQAIVRHWLAPVHLHVGGAGPGLAGGGGGDDHPDDDDSDPFASTLPIHWDDPSPGTSANTTRG